MTILHRFSSKDTTKSTSKPQIIEQEYIPQDTSIPTTLLFNFNGALQRNITVTTLDKSTTLYTINVRCTRKPNLTFTANGTTVGTSTFHTMKPIDLTIANQTLQLKTASRMSCRKFTYASPALNGAEVTWQVNGKGVLKFPDLVALDDQAMPLGKFVFGHWVKTAGTMEIAEGTEKREMGRALVDELVVVGFTLAELQMQVYSAAVAGATA
ncbi:hypothetical protein BT63DRAFT_425614 [Microthyrium microscopicum]|uniref:Uncharacterized protein n=1 Tax=Microthyrium microscopicum TaxID=703497 RepID=A0A6A6U8J3_9PEZI|nr:hypothetical protein BT63DRAFT_425614 [Microthyrium microscopicum]